MAKHHLSKEHTLKNNNEKVLLKHLLAYSPKQIEAERIANALIKAKLVTCANTKLVTCANISALYHAVM